MNKVSGLTISQSVSSFPVDMFDFISSFYFFYRVCCSNSLTSLKGKDVNSTIWLAEYYILALR